MILRTITRACLLAAVLALPLSACGKLGQLERPGPLNGAGRSTTKAADDVEMRRQDPNHPVDTIDPRDEVTSPKPPRTLPIQSSGEDPFAGPPIAGALPDPYNNPRP